MSPLQVAQLNPIKRDTHPQSLHFVTFRAPNKGAHPPSSPYRAPIERERDAPFPEPPYSYLSEFPVIGRPWDDVCPLSPPPHIYLDPQKGAPLTELPQREMLPFQSPPTVS